MLVRAARPDDFPRLLASFRRLRKDAQDDLAQQLQRRLASPQTTPTYVAVERARSSAGAWPELDLLGVVCAGPSRPGYTGMQLQELILHEQPGSGDSAQLSRAALARALYEALTRELQRRRVSDLWICADSSMLPLYLNWGATEVGLVESNAEPPFASQVLLRARLNKTPDELLSKRLQLRAWSSADYAPFAQLNQDPLVNRYLPGPLSETQSDEVAERIVSRLQRDGFGYWAVALRGAAPGSSDAFLGFVGIGPVTELAPVRQRLGHPALELGWRLAPPYWGKGYATEAARAALDYATHNLHAYEAVSFTVAENHPSRRVMEKLGLQQDPHGSFMHPRLPREHPLAHHLLYRKRLQHASVHDDAGPTP